LKSTANKRLALLPATLLALALAPALAAAGGTVAGKVDVTPARFQDETVVYLKAVPGKRPPARHAMDQNGMKFVPFVLTVTKGDAVEFLNNDGVEHEVFSPDGERFNLGKFLFGDKRAYTFERPGLYEIKCSLHPMMQAWVFVGENPYAAALDRKGRFRIEDVPAGTYQLALWNAHVKAPERTVTVADGQTVEQTFSLKP
jgi:plastocyanin